MAAPMIGFLVCLLVGIVFVIAMFPMESGSPAEKKLRRKIKSQYKFALLNDLSKSGHITFVPIELLYFYIATSNYYKFVYYEIGTYIPLFRYISNRSVTLPHTTSTDLDLLKTIMLRESTDSVAVFNMFSILERNFPNIKIHFKIIKVGKFKVALLHNEHGPAIIDKDLTLFFVDGEPCDLQEFFHKTNMSEDRQVEMIMRYG